MTSSTLAMFQTHPLEINLDRGQLASVIDLLNECAEACTACADACLSEGMVSELVKCIRTNMDCADICTATARVLSRHTGYDANISRTLLSACAQACASCRDQCAQHGAEHDHCRICAEVCDRCERACNDLLVAMR
jgi:hypothetical protein